MTERGVEIWVFYPGNQRESVAKAIRVIKDTCADRCWEIQERHVQLVKINGRPLGKLKPEDAINLYKRIHRANVGIWHFGETHAPRKPEPDDKIKDYIDICAFVQHKAFRCRVQNSNFSEQWGTSVAEFETWLNEIHCENESDPRCLPAHLFNMKSDSEDLTTPEGRAQFTLNYGNQSARTDARQLVWKRPLGAFHGREILYVAGCELARGFHWDVGAGRNGGKIVSAQGVWRISSNHYVNVYPDAHIRSGRGAARRKTGR